MTHRGKPKSILSFKQFITESEIKESSGNWVKGWVNPKKNKVISLNSDFRTYHTTAICRHPRKFGISKREIMKVLDVLAASTNRGNKILKTYGIDKSDVTGEDIYETILNDKYDRNMDLEFLVMKKGWYTFYFGEYTEISGMNLKDDDVREAYYLLEREIKNVERPTNLEIVEYTFKPRNIPGVKNSHLLNEISKKTKSYTGYSDILRFLKGKNIGDNRSEIGRTMAMFRGESVRKRRNKRSGMINSGFRYR